MKQTINLKDLPKGGPYSHAVVNNGVVFLAGQTGNIPGKQLTFREQFNNAMEKISKILEASGSSLDRILKVSVFLSKPEFFQEMNDLFGKHFGKDPPVRTTIVTNFTSPEVLVELDVTATQ
jgi:2-iminobutanoate/2-iminopropanoate deaminase